VVARHRGGGGAGAGRARDRTRRAPPLGRGFLSGAIRSLDELPAQDVRRRTPRFGDANFARNLASVDALCALTAAKDATPAQVALAWLLAQGEHVVPIPGTKRVRYLEENRGALDVELTPAEVARIAASLPQPVGARGDEDEMRLLYG
jgi:aryl-alcohol dehydrogenase-like predicted oxidoreductase